MRILGAVDAARKVRTVCSENVLVRLMVRD